MSNVQLAPVHARLLNGWTTLAHVNVPSAPHTGDALMFTLASFTVPGGTMGPNGRLRITPMYSFVGAGNTRNIAINFGGVNVWTVGSLAATTLACTCQVVIANRNSQSSQVMSARAAAGFGISTVITDTSAIDTTVDKVLDIRGQLVNAADSVTLEAYLIEVLYGA